MDVKNFENAYASICELNASEGPSRNVFEPKFMARDQMIALRTTITNIIRETRGSLRAQSQYCRCLVFIGNNMIETDEVTEGVQNLLLAYQVICRTVVGEVVDDASKFLPTPLSEILTTDKHLFADGNSSMTYAFEYLDTMNSICVYLANQDDEMYRLDDATKVLHLVEAAYKAWDLWFLQSPLGCSIDKVPVGDDGKVTKEGLSDELEAVYTQRRRMDTCHTTALFLLSQVYGAKGDAASASKYCHYTMAWQLKTKQEFSRKEWAKNAITLSTYYCSIRDFGKGLYCLAAGEHMMPTTPADEETRGVVCWGHGRFYINRLAYYAAVLQGNEELVEGNSRADEWWVDFSLPIPSPSKMKHIKNFDDAREDFKEGNRWLQEALKYYVVDGCCSDHIAILQDTSNLYKHLVAFEADVDRQIAMHQRRVALVEKFPAELNFQAYTTLIRQLLFDLGDISTEILDLRMLQRKNPDGKFGKPISDTKVNQITAQCIDYFNRFCATFKDLKSQKVPDVLDQEARVPYFRALMRIAHLQSRLVSKTPQEQYDDIAKSMEKYQAVLAFADKNKLPEDTDHELRLAREMVDLLPGKQKDIWLRCSKSR